MNTQTKPHFIWELPIGSQMMVNMATTLAKHNVNLSDLRFRQHERHSLGADMYCEFIAMSVAKLPGNEERRSSVVQTTLLEHEGEIKGYCTQFISLNEDATTNINPTGEIAMPLNMKVLFNVMEDLVQSREHGRMIIDNLPKVWQEGMEEAVGIALPLIMENRNQTRH